MNRDISKSVESRIAEQLMKAGLLKSIADTRMSEAQYNALLIATIRKGLGATDQRRPPAGVRL